MEGNGGQKTIVLKFGLSPLSPFSMIWSQPSQHECFQFQKQALAIEWKRDKKTMHEKVANASNISNTVIETGNCSRETLQQGHPINHSKTRLDS